VAEPFSVLSLRATDKKSSSSLNEVDISLVNSQLTYFRARNSMITGSCKTIKLKGSFDKS
jgi:hypothetical protein